MTGIKALFYRTILLLLCSIGCSFALAQDEAAEAGAEPEEAIDEITVYGEQSLSTLKMEYEAAELSFYNLYNELNDDRKYDVVCRKETRKGSHIKHRICWPRYQLDARTQEARAKFFRGEIDPGVMALDIAEEKVMKERIAKIAEENPQLLEALVEYHEKYTTYDSEKRRRCIGCGDMD